MRLHKSLKFLVLLALASGIVGGVSAQDTKKDEVVYQLKKFYVYGDRYKNTSELGGKINKELKYIPSSINVVTDKDIQKHGATSLSEALEYEAGVIGTYRSETSLANSPIIRGFEVKNSNLLVDGMKAYGYYGHMLNPDMYGLEKIEVLKGPSSTFNGAGSVSGVINMQMKAPKKENFKEVEVRVGSKNKKTIRFDINEYKKDKDVAVRFVGSIDKKDLFYDKSSQERIYIAPSISQQINAKDNLTIKAFYQSDFVDGNAFYGFERLKGHVFYGKVPDKAFVGVKGWDKLDYKQWGINYEWEHKFNEEVSLHHKGGLRGTSILSQQTMGTPFKDEFEEWENNGTPITLFIRTAPVIDSSGMSYNLDQYIKIHKEKENIKKDTIIGVDYHYETIDTNNQLRVLSVWGIDNVKAYLSGERISREPPIPLNSGPKYNYNDHEWGMYASHNEKRGKFEYSFGLRRGFYSSHDGSPKFGYKKHSTSATTGQVGIVYEMTDELLPYAHWNNSFEPVHDHDKDGKLLKPQTGRQYEVGLRYEPKNKNVKASIAIFDLAKQNVPIANQTDPDENKWYAESIGEMVSRGVDVKIVKVFENDWKVKAAYSFNRTKIVKSFSKFAKGKYFINAPKHMLNVGIEKVIKKYSDGNITLGLDMRYLGKRAQDSLNRTHLGGVTVFDSNVSYTKGNNEINLKVKNLFNKKYYTSIYDNWGPIAYLGAERSVFVSYTHKW